MVKKWFSETWCSCTNDEFWTRQFARQFEVTTPETTEEIRDMVLDDQGWKVCKIVEAGGIAQG